MASQEFQPPISKKQAEVLRDAHRYRLIAGPRFSTKSFGCLHDLVWNLWSVPENVATMISRTVSASLDSGLWTLLTQRIIPDWIEGNIYAPDGRTVIDKRPFGMEWVTKPKMEAVSHRMVLDVSNVNGTSSRCYLESLDVEREVDIKFRGRQFGYIYLVEGDNFSSRHSFDVLQECLRLPQIRPEDHKFVIDSNPPADGLDHWLGRLFFWFRELNLDAPNADTLKALQLGELSGDELKDAVLALQEFQNQLAVHLFSVDDNIWLDERGKRLQRAKYSHNRSLFDRFYKGIWVKASNEGYFSEVLRPDAHFLGEYITPSNPEPDIILPQEDCIELGIGFDIGNRRNTAITFIEPYQTDVIDLSTGNSISKPAFSVIDELMLINTPQDFDKITEGVLEKMDFWESVVFRITGKIPRWEMWSDSSSFSYNALAETTEARELLMRSDGRINLRSVTDLPNVKIKGHDGIKRGIDLIFRLLFEDRIVVSKAKCPVTIDMLNNIGPGANGKINMADPRKHPKDSLKYYLMPKCWEELQKVPRLRTKNESRGVMVTSL